MKKIKLGNTILKNNLVMAPLAGYTDWPFRKLLSRFECSLSFTEMISAKSLSMKNTKTRDMLFYEKVPGDHLLGVQLFGNETSSMVKASEIVQEMGYKVIDINIGCPCPKVVKNGSGSWLMKDPAKLKGILSGMRKVIKIPFTGKIRIGWTNDSMNAVEIARIIEGEGLDAIFVHGRTRAQGFSGVPNLEKIREVKESVKIPVFGNGNIVDVESAQKMFDETKCDGLMLGRYGFEDPSVFDRIDAVINNEPVPPFPTTEEKFIYLRELCLNIFEFCGERRGVNRSKCALLFCLRNFNGASAMRRELSHYNTKDEFVRFFDNVIPRINPPFCKGGRGGI